MITSSHSPSLWGYSLATLFFLVFAIRFAVRSGGNPRAHVLLAAVVSSALWSGTVVLVLLFPSDSLWFVARLFDALRLAIWLLFLVALLLRPKPGEEAGARPRRIVVWGIEALTALLFVGALLPQPYPWARVAEPVGPNWAFADILAIAAIGLLLVEQLYRRTPAFRRWAIKPLALGLGGIFVLELVTYSGAFLAGHIDPWMWAARGVSHAIVLPLIAVATDRNKSWTVKVHLSREVVVHSSTALLSGAYLLLVAFAGYWVRYFGGDWGKTLEITFVFVALLALGTLLLSGSLRARLSLFINKNFFSHRYDYRKEWLRFTSLLGNPARGETIYDQVVRALAGYVEGMGGALWLERKGAFKEYSNWNVPTVGETEPSSSPLTAFLAKTGWVVQLDELATAPDRYPGLELPQWLKGLRDAWLIVPLPVGTELVGFAILTRPRTPVDVNWEVQELLKTAGRQAASYLAHLRASEALLEAEKFDAFNRMSAFVVHDIKNLVSQLALVSRNAERHGSNPEFQKDMLETIEHVTSRMTRLMQQLSNGQERTEEQQPVDMQKVVDRVAESKRRLGVAIETVRCAPAVILANPERIERIVGHFVQNAIDATGAGGSAVVMDVSRDSQWVVVEIRDAGSGMTEDFIRERLFRPYQTTKANGMGIGMYESYQYIHGIGGKIHVESAPGQGTLFRISLPLS